MLTDVFFVAGKLSTSNAVQSARLQTKAVAMNANIAAKNILTMKSRGFSGLADSVGITTNRD